MMEKKALEVEPRTVGRFALGGLVTGASTAALLNLLRKVNQMRQERQQALSTPQTDEDTIVLTLPGKQAEIKTDTPTKVERSTTTKSISVSGPGKQFRRVCDGTFGPKTAAGWPTLTASTLAGLGSTAVGAHLVNKIYEKRRQQELQAELDAAQEEYMDQLKQGKAADWIESTFAVPMDKDAQSSTFGFLDYPLAAAALLSVLGGGSTAFITKKLLDQKFQEAQSRGLDIPKVRRIVFQTQPGAAEKTGSMEDIDCVKAAFGVMLDRVGAETKVLAQPYVKEAMAEVDTSALKLLKLAQDTDILIEYLRQTPTLRNMIQRATMEQHPVLKHFRWGAKIPGVRGALDDKLYAKLRNMGPQTDAPTKIARAAMSTGDLIGGMLGGMVGGNNDAQPDEIANAVVAAQQKAESDKNTPEPTPEEQAEGVKLEASDPEAAAYLEQNKEKVLAVLKQMAATGKL
jgi:hypothetical protein